MTINQQITLFYDTFGLPENPAVVLIPGLGGHNISWASDFCQQIAQAGFFIIRIDNRDSGLSPHFDSDTPINLAELVQKLQRGETIDAPYTLFNMAGDVVHLLDMLSIKKAHIIGRSMGGMIAQLVAAKYPERTLSLCPIMSSTGNQNVSQSEPDVMQMLMSSGVNPNDNLEGYLAGQLAFYRRISSSCCPFAEDYYRDYILKALARRYSPEGTKRQIIAVAMTGDMRPYLGSINVPTLVIHGSIDPLFPLSAGQDIANNIKNARLMVIEGMGHETPPALNSRIADNIIEHLKNSVN